MKFRTSSIFGGAPLIYDRFGLAGVSGRVDLVRIRCDLAAAARKAAWSPQPSLPWIRPFAGAARWSQPRAVIDRQCHTINAAVARSADQFLIKQSLNHLGFGSPMLQSAPAEAKLQKTDFLRY
ncbi:hypothetical protein [Phaeobacter inhibens]|uniref:hypothetical protein n=1 Tax=Phaeobacter inhibens TaxID=221822 RepID=UPI0021A6E2C8|nr:hypothetical protein [Phaeobacter inhibens]UWS00465.1 hypothetical protein K4L03_01085 [Phaeobacter inhibens]